MASCAERLHQIQKDVGLSDAELEAAVRDVARPREVKLPVFHEKLPKSERIRQEISSDTKQRKLDMVYWYLEEYLKPEFAQEIYAKYEHFKDMVEDVYEMVLDLFQLNSFELGEIEDLSEIFDEPEYVSEFDIPDINWKSFDDYCEKHPIKNAADIIIRREEFKLSQDKKRRRYYSAKRMRMYDPIFALDAVNEEAMIENLQRITRENELRVKEFQKMLNSLVEDKSIGSVAMAKFNETTKAVLDNQKRRLKSFMKGCKCPTNSIVLDIDDEPSVVFK